MWTMDMVGSRGAVRGRLQIKEEKIRTFRFYRHSIDQIDCGERKVMKYEH